MKLKNSIVAAAVLGMSVTFLPQASAEYVMAYHRSLSEETLLVDTSSIFEEGHNAFNVIAYDILNDGKTETKNANTYKYKYDDDKNVWMILTKNGDTKEWNVVEKNSNAQDVLKVCLPYLKK